MINEPHLLAALLDPAHYRYNPMALWHFGAAAVILVCTRWCSTGSATASTGSRQW